MRKFFVFNFVLSLLVVCIQLVAPSITSAAEEKNPNKEDKDSKVIVGYHSMPDNSDKNEIVSAEGKIKHVYKIIPAIAATLNKAGIEKVKKNPKVKYVEPDYEIQIDLTPNDPRFPDLWGLHNTGQTGGTYDADIDAPEAWDYHTGSHDVVVAVVDTGVGYTHEDLAANMWVNPGEGPTPDGLDNDGNGYVDDIYGYDFCNYDSDPWDDHGHGTHCSGTIAGVGNNGIGVAGVNWSAQIMALKFLSASGSGYTSDAELCLEYVILMKQNYGIPVIATSNSYGGGGYSFSFWEAIEAANSAGILFVAAAGNSGTDNDIYPHYPSSYNNDNVIAVAATDHNDRLVTNPPWTWGSCYGLTSVDLGAPGLGIWSTLPGNSYASWSGTSMATPHVSGAVALVKAAFPGLTHIGIRSRIFNSVDPLPTLIGKTVTGGRLNLLRLFETGDPDISVSPSSLSAILQPGEIDTQTLNIANEGTATLTFQIEIDMAVSTQNAPSPNNPVIIEEKGSDNASGTGPVVIEGQGGPDGYGYVWIDSDEPDGPEFDYIDISSTGTQITGLSDDNFAGPFPVGFTFAFYGIGYTQFYVSSNGFIGFGPTTSYYSLSNGGIPNTSTPNNIICWLWDDLYPQSDSHVYYGLVEGNLVIQFVNYGEYGGSGRVNAEVILYPNGHIKLQYDSFINGFDTQGCTVGIENQSGDDGLQIALNTSYLHDDLAIYITPFWLRVAPMSGAVPPGGSLSVDVTFDSTGLCGDSSCVLLVHSNDPDEPTVDVPADMSVDCTIYNTIRALAGANGGISPSGDVQVPAGGSQTFVITPYESYQVSSITVWDQLVDPDDMMGIDGTPQGIALTYTFHNVLSDHTLYVTFAAETKNITINLYKGLNMVSCPGIPIIAHIPTLVSGLPIVPSGMEFDPITKSYIESKTLQFGKGYWFYATASTQLTIEYYPRCHMECVVRKGASSLNMVGSVDQIVPASSMVCDPPGSVLPYATWYDPVQKKYVSVPFTPGKGHWVYCKVALARIRVDCPVALNQTLAEIQSSPIWESVISIDTQSQHQELVFGVHQYATQGFDISLDRPFIPFPDFMDESIKAFWKVEDPDFPQLDKSFVGSGSQLNWELILQLPEPGELQCKNLPTGYRCLLVQEDGRIIHIEDGGSIRLPAGEHAFRLMLSAIIKKTQLLANYPNPFNPETWIPYNLSADGDVLLMIYDSLGREIRRFHLRNQLAGEYQDKLHAIYWDGRNESGETVSSGVYFYTLEAAGVSQTGKMVIVR